MYLIIGGLYQGKTDFVIRNFNIKKNEILDCKDMGISDIICGKVLYNFNALISRLSSNNEDITKFINELLAQNSNVIIIINEVGCGIIPDNEEERKYRELIGRISCILAEKADYVYRVICGIGVKIKGD